MKHITIITIGTRLISTIPIFFTVKSDADYLLVPLYNSLGTILSGIISLLIIYKTYKNYFKIPSMSDILLTLKGSFFFFLSRLSVSVYTTSNTFILGLVAGNTMVGYYSAAEKVFIAIQNVYSPISNALYPYMANKKDVKTFRIVLIGVIIINMLFISFLLLYSDQIISLIFGASNIVSGSILKFLLLACIVIVPSILIGYPFLGALGYAKYVNFTVITASIIHFILLVTLYFTNHLSVVSVAVIVLLTETVVFLLRLFGCFYYKLFKRLLNHESF